ncbi:hypothetical protein Save01_08456 [Streptomyces avermitilis]
MRKRSEPYVPPSWARPGNSWGPWLYWPMLCLGIGLLVWRIVDGDGTGRILVSAGMVLVWIWLLVANRSARRRRPT